MHFHVLGPLEVVKEDAALPLGGPKQRALLAILILRANELVSSDQLIEALWGEESPRAAANTVQVYVSRLRKLLGADRLSRRHSGYVLRIERDEFDRAQFEQLVEDSRTGEPASARETLRQALGLWRGPPLADLAHEDFAQSEIRRLDELRAVALEQRIEADLALGEHAALVPELEALVTQHPLRERLRAHQMLALYRAGRQAEALASYENARLTLLEELGLEPSGELRALQRAILRQDETLVTDVTPALQAPEDPGYDRLKVVTCLFCDVSSSPVLERTTDPESLRELLGRFVARMREAAQRHAGVVSTFVGDSVLVVFGEPTVHEDDALRAVRAAADMRTAIADLGLEARIAISTGEVVTGGDDWPLTGDAVRVAARLAQSAEPGEVLIAPATLELLEDVAAVAPASGDAVRLISVADTTSPRRLDSPFVGRAEELATLVREFERARTDRTCRLCTVAGAPGIGKSRLAQELVTTLAADARAVEGRCLSYGEGITYRPLAEIVHEVAGPETERGLAGVLSGVPDAALIAARIAGALGGTSAAGSAEETFWAFRRLFEALAGVRPLIVVVDDAHWAEATLLDLLEYVVGYSTGAPILVLCLARPDLFDVRPSWTTPRANAATLSLRPLSETESDQLVRELAARHEVPESEWPRITAAAEGNPLFVEQLVAMRREGESAVPSTIQALLAARIDRLRPEERAVIDRASVEGRTFHRGAVANLLPPALAPSLASSLIGLVRRELIRPDRSVFPGDDAFRFNHVLIMEAAYEGIPKEGRAELHERLADWLAAKADDRLIEYDEILGYHLERAFRYRSEVGIDESCESLAARAADHLGSAGERAYARDDMHTAASLLERALALPWDEDRRRVELGLRLASALLDLGRAAEAEAAADVAAGVAAAQGDRAGELRAELFRGQVTIWTSPDFATLLPLARGALPWFAEAEDSRGSMEAWRVIALGALDRERYGDAAEAFGKALEYARALESRVDEKEILGWLEYALSHGPMPVKEILRWAEEASLPLLELEPAVSSSRAVLLAMDGRVAEARELCADAELRLNELAMQLWLAPNTEFVWHVATVAGDYVEAEKQARRGCNLYEEMESETGLGLCAGMLAQTLSMQGRDAEAERWSEISEQKMPTDGIAVDGGARRWRHVRAKILARRGELDGAERLVREAVALAERTDSLRAQAEAHFDLAEVLRLAGRDDEAATATAQAMTCCERKGIAVMLPAS